MFFMSLGAIDMQVLTDLKSQVLISPDPFGIRRSRTTGTKGRRSRTTVAWCVARDRPSPYGSRDRHAVGLTSELTSCLLR